jgi:hypothetical protein
LQHWSVGLPQSNVTVLLAYGIFVSVAVLSLCSYTIIREYRQSVTDVSALQLTALAIAFHLVGPNMAILRAEELRLWGSQPFDARGTLQLV